LRAVRDARDHLTVVELGAGWGPWIVAAAFAARLRGIGAVRLVGVEGAKEHYEFLHRHLVDNGLDPDRHTLLHAVVGVRDGSAQFPVLDNPGHYGAAAVGAGLPAVSSKPGPALLRRLRAEIGRRVKPYLGYRSRSTVRVPCLTLRSILRDLGVVDLLHIDIQGHEADVLASSAGVLENQVRRMVVGTHGRSIEARLHEVMSARGWVLETDEACLFTQSGNTITLALDGCQAWRNRNLLPGTSGAV
jgi:FkbM family methyltransferase